MLQLTLKEQEERAYYISMILKHPRVSLTILSSRIYDDKLLRKEPIRGTSDSAIAKRMKALGITYPYNTGKKRHDDSTTYISVLQLKEAGFLEDWEPAAEAIPEVILIPEVEEVVITIPPPVGKTRFIINGFKISSATEKEATDWYNFLTNP